MQVNGIAKAETSASRLQQAQQALAAAEWEESKERRQLSVLEAHEQQLSSELQRARTIQKAPRTPDTIEATQKQLDALSRKREEFARQRAIQGEVVREARERLRVAHRAYEELQRRTLELQNTIRREERTVAQWQRQVKDTEHQLARWERMLTEAQARLEQARWEHAELAGPHWKTS